MQNISKAIKKAELLVRVNPIHEASSEYTSSKEEIDGAIANGANIVMLPFFKTINEVKEFISYVDGRAKTMLLLETPEAVEIIDDILDIKGVDEIFIGLNDLSLGYRKKFMFELLADGTVENLCFKFKKKGIPYGFGGIAALGKGMLPAEKIITEHYRLGSTCVILSRSFCNVDKISHMGEISNLFVNGIQDIRNFEKQVSIHSRFFENNIKEVEKGVGLVLENIK